MHVDNNERLLLHIILRWLGFYALLYFLYRFILTLGSPDFFTLLTSGQVNAVYRFLGFPSHWKVVDAMETGIFFDGQWVVRIVEGCNGMSIIILFVSFIWAWPVSIRKKLFFTLKGILLIWIINILRIVLLGWVYYRYPSYFDTMHRVIFPALIYGTVILLWMIWALHVRKVLPAVFQKVHKQNE